MKRFGEVDYETQLKKIGFKKVMVGSTIAYTRPGLVIPSEPPKK